MARYSTCVARRSRGFMASAIAWRRRRRAPIGRAAGRSGRSSRSPIGQLTQRTQKPHDVSDRSEIMNRICKLSMVFAAVLALAASASHAQDAQDTVALGKKLTTNNCAVCHTFGKGEPDGQGPNLFGIVGRPFASEPGFKYSAAMKAAAPGKVWDDKL